MSFHEEDPELARRYGPREVRARKTREYIENLLSQVPESVLRGLLIALSRLETPRCAHWLSKIDLAAAPLHEIIKPYEICGLNFDIDSVEDPLYTVKIGAAWGTAGDGGRFRIRRDGDSFLIDEDFESMLWIA